VYSDIINEGGLDVFGQTKTELQKQSSETFQCVNCQRSVMSTRFAPHLEKCMGLGRFSSRIASKRLALQASMNQHVNGSTAKTKNFWEEMSDPEDTDYMEASSKEPHVSSTARKEKKESKQSKKMKKLKTEINENGDSLFSEPVLKYGSEKNNNDNSVTHSSMNIISQTNISNTQIGDDQGRSRDKLKEVLSKTCGVISSSTGKMCTKTVNCPQHTDPQRENIRFQLLGKQVSMSVVREKLRLEKLKKKSSKRVRIDNSLSYTTARHSKPTEPTGLLEPVDSLIPFDLSNNDHSIIDQSIFVDIDGPFDETSLFPDRIEDEFIDI